MTFIKPVVSVITVVLDNVNGFRKTAQSVINQQYPGIEFIVIDGFSTDGTLQVIQKFADKIHFWSSGPDTGIYDAMNKGIRHAGGEWIIFMNAGDVFSDPQVLSHVFENDHSDSDVIYGDSIADYGPFSVIRKAGSMDDLWKGMPFCHQAMLTRTSVVKSRGFSAEYKIAADFEMVFRLFSIKSNFRYVPGSICTFDVLGVSNQHYIQSWKERYSIYKTYRNGHLTEKLFYLYLLGVFTITLLAYNLLPGNLVNKFVKYRNRKELI